MPIPIAPTLDAQRHHDQLAFLARKLPLDIGAPSACPLPPPTLAKLDEGADAVLQCIASGLTAYVYQLEIDGAQFALKQARPSCLVQNTDGRLSFLNELLRRRDIAALQHERGGFAGMVPTHYASLTHGIILSPWVNGAEVEDWDERKLSQLFASGRELVEQGLFEWDPSPGNLLDDGRQLWLFDLGYMYRFDPLRQFNSAGHGDDVPLFHLAERFETRSYFAWLLGLERSRGDSATLAAFRLEKEIALDCYGQLRASLARRGAVTLVLDWLDGIMRDWRGALAGPLDALYLREGWRSHVMDLDDDLRGQTCTPRTLARCDWLLATLADHFDALRTGNALLHDDVGMDRQALIARYRTQRERAEALLVSGH